MQPPSHAGGIPLQPVDAFDVPVLVRRSSPLVPGRRPHHSRIERADQPWPTPGNVPAGGLYRVATTWRDVVDAALSVGRDPTAWLVAVPALAWSEIIARRSPLAAYLGRQSTPSGTGARVAPNVVYRDGTERSARAAFGYRIGMTMAEWACRGLMGLGPTTHAEAVTPADAGPAWSAFGSLPDLVGDHPTSPTTWLIEAKGRRRMARRDLIKGARQLSNPGLLNGPHLRVLCGTSIEHCLSMTIDIEEHTVDGHPQLRRNAANLVEDDESLLALSRSRMLLYLALTAISPTERRIVPIGFAPTEVADRSRGGTVTPLEFDPTTRQERAAARDAGRYERRDGRERRDMLTGRVPGTDLIIGMSRRLFSACRNLEAVQQRAAATVDRERPPASPGRAERMDIEELATYERQRRTLYWQHERLLTRDATATIRAGFETGEQSTWPALLDQYTRFRRASPVGFLEAATADTYLALDLQTAIR